MASGGSSDGGDSDGSVSVGGCFLSSSLLTLSLLFSLAIWESEDDFDWFTSGSTFIGESCEWSEPSDSSLVAGGIDASPPSSWISGVAMVTIQAKLSYTTNDLALPQLLRCCAVQSRGAAEVQAATVVGERHAEIAIERVDVKRAVASYAAPDQTSDSCGSK